MTGGPGYADMTATPPSSPTLADLRRDIDRIDASMHALLMDRGEIIDRLIAVKRAQETGSAFRPGREAAMMREIIARHRGILPVDIVESIWRVIIATFTHVQAPYSVHGDTSLGGGVMRDVARFHFGFVVPYETHEDAGSVIAAVAASRGDLGLVPAAALGAWWRALEAPEAPKVIARLPFVERAHHPAAMPTYVLSKPIEEAAAVTDVRLYSVELSQDDGAFPPDIRVEAQAGSARLLALGVDSSVEHLASALPGPTSIIPVGSHAAPFSHPSR
jgi:chorismate mutase